MITEFDPVVEQPGRHEATFDAGALPSGLYFSVLRTQTLTVSRLMSVVK
jgi:hypothetical protein